VLDNIEKGILEPLKYYRRIAEVGFFKEQLRYKFPQCDI
jgi:hypothetical protein